MLDPAMPPQAAPTWPKARWIGLLDLDECTPDADGEVEFVPRHAEGYGLARVLMRRGTEPLGFVEACVRDGRVRLPATAVQQIQRRRCSE